MATEGLPSLRADDPVDSTPRRRGMLVAAAVALVLVGWLATTIGGDPPNDTSPRPPAARPPASAAPSGSPAVTWQDVAGLALPVSAVAGPRDVSPRGARGFAHTDAGAAFAAVHILVRTFPFVGTRVFGPTIAEQVDGRDAAALARLTEQAYQQTAQAARVRDGGPIHSEGGAIAGYRIDDPGTATAGKDAATAYILIRQTGNPEAEGFTEYRVQLVWHEGDWHVIAPAWGDWRNAARAMPSADPAAYSTYDTPGTEGAQ
jgi:hypothetical protein